jgi:hypothetical protein
MYRVANNRIDVEELRARLPKMSDAHLLRLGKAAKYMCSPDANLGKPLRKSQINLILHTRLFSTAHPDCGLSS